MAQTVHVTIEVADPDLARLQADADAFVRSVRTYGIAKVSYDRASPRVDVAKTELVLDITEPPSPCIARRGDSFAIGATADDARDALIAKIGPDAVDVVEAKLELVDAPVIVEETIK